MSKLKTLALELAASVITSLPYTKLSSKIVDKIIITIEADNVNGRN